MKDMTSVGNVIALLEKWADDYKDVYVIRDKKIHWKCMRRDVAEVFLVIREEFKCTASALERRSYSYKSGLPTTHSMSHLQTNRTDKSPAEALCNRIREYNEKNNRNA